MASMFPAPRPSKRSKSKSRSAAMLPPSSMSSQLRSNASQSTARRGHTKPRSIFKDSNVVEFYNIFQEYSNNLVTLLSENAESRVRQHLAQELELAPSDAEYKREYKQLFAKTWSQYLKHARKWNQTLLDREVVRILKSMAGIVADLDSDSDSEDDEGRDVPEFEEDLATYRDSLSTYLEYARWKFMESVTDSDSDPVDDIPATSLPSFVCYFVHELTRHRAVKNNMFLDYDEVNQSKVLEPCIMAALRRTIPPTVYTALLKANMTRSRNHRSMQSSAGHRSRHRRQPVVRASTQFSADMMSSRAVAARINTDNLRNTMHSADISSSALPVVRDDDQEPKEKVEPVSVASTALVHPTDALSEAETKEVVLESPAPDFHGDGANLANPSKQYNNHPDNENSNDDFP